MKLKIHERRYRKIKVDSLFIDKEVLKGFKRNEQRSFMAYTYESEYVKEHGGSFQEIKTVFLVPIKTEEKVVDKENKGGKL